MLLERERARERERERGAIAPLRAPAAPTRDEVEEREASVHAGCITWWRACIAGRGRSDAHVGLTRDEQHPRLRWATRT